MKLKVRGDNLQVYFDSNGDMIIEEKFGPKTAELKPNQTPRYGMCPGCDDSMCKDLHTCQGNIEVALYDTYRDMVIELLPYFGRMSRWEQSFITGIAQFILNESMSERQEESLIVMHENYVECK